MLRLIVLLVCAFAIASGLAWLAERPGNLILNWQGYEVETSVFRAVVILALMLGTAVFLWSLMRQLWLSPAAIGNVFNRRRQKRGLEALSTGLIALGAGDRDLALRYSVQARRTLPNEPLTHLLRAQAARLAGDTTTARRIFEAMLSSPDTEQLGLRGLFMEAQAEGEVEAARQFAERAIQVNPKLGWAADALFDLQCKQKDWEGALVTLAIARKHGHVDKATADRRRAVLLTAQAQPAEDADPDRALSLASEAHNLAPDLVPAAAIAGRILASRGSTPRATKVIQQTWRKAPHPDLAMAYAYARIGDSPRDRLQRVKQLAMLAPMSIESPIALATAAIEAKDWDEARSALEPLIEGRLTQRVCTLMARIEGEQYGDKGRVREWLARAVNAPRDPAWTADGVVSDTWQPVSPVTGMLDAFQWKVPVELAEKGDAGLVAQKLEELVALGAPRENLVPAPVPVIEAETITVAPVPAPRRDDADIVETHAVEPAGIGKAADDAAPEVEKLAPAPIAETTGKPVAVASERTRRPAVEQESAPTVPTSVAAAPATESPSKAADAAPAATAARSAGASESEVDAKVTSIPVASPGLKGRNSLEPKIFVPPRAPDDPGTESEEGRRSSLARFRTTSPSG